MLALIRAACRGNSGGFVVGIAAVGAVGVGLAAPGCGELKADAGGQNDGGGGEGPLDDAAGVVPGGDAGTSTRERLNCDQSLPYPQFLGCTGLYANWQSDALAPTVKEYKPGVEQWSDGAEKRRWIQLPPGGKVDVSDMNEWKFPVDTKLWKEFALTVGGKRHRIETRFLWKLSDQQWVRATYRWNDDESNAIELREGEPGALGTTYEVPSQAQCTTCHKGRKDMVLGFDAIGLAADTATGLTYETLRSQGLLVSTGGATPVPSKPNLQIPGTDTERAALGYVHVNCGVSCHSGSDQADAIQGRLPLRLDTATTPGGPALPTSAAATTVARNTVGVRLAAFVPPGEELPQLCRVLPGNPAQSAMIWRAGRRDPTPDVRHQMPSIGTHQLDPKGLTAMSNWISGMTPGAGYPQASDAGCSRPDGG